MNENDIRADRNRKNALASTGPKSPKGKKRSSQNALTYGLRSQSAVMPGESVEEWSAFQDDVARDLNAQNSTERALSHSVASNLWRLARGARYEAQCVAGRLSREELIARYEEHLKSHPVEMRIKGHIHDFSSVLHHKEMAEDNERQVGWYESIALIVANIEAIEADVEIDRDLIKEVGILAKVPKEILKDILRTAKEPSVEDIHSVLKYAQITPKEIQKRIKARAESSKKSAARYKQSYEEASQSYEAGLASFATRFFVPTKEDLERLQTYEAHIHRNLQRTLDTFKQFREIQAMGAAGSDIKAVASIVKTEPGGRGGGEGA